MLSAFGGGGPMGVLAVADAAGLDTVLVPRLSAVFSAHGIGFSDIAHMSELKLASNDSADLEAAMAELRARVGRDMFSEGFELAECELQAWLRVNGDQSRHRCRRTGIARHCGCRRRSDRRFPGGESG